MADIARYLNIRSAFLPSFAPDGCAVAFITNITGVPQVWRVPVQGGWPEQLTFFSDRVSSVSYAPGRDVILFGMDIGGNERTQLLLLADDGARTVPLTADYPNAIHYVGGADGGWSPDGQRVAFTANRRSVADFDVYVQTIGVDEPEEATLVHQATGTHYVRAWGADGRWLLVLDYHTPSNQDLYRLDLDTGGVTPLTSHTGDARYTEVALSPDGQTLFYATDEASDVLRAVALNINTREMRYLTDESWDVDHLALSPDGSILAIVTNQDGQAAWRLIDLASGQDLPTPRLPLGMIPMGLSWSPDGCAIAFDYTGPQHPSDVWVYSFEEGWHTLLEQTAGQYSPTLPQSPHLVRATRSSRAGIADRSFVVPELVRYPTFDDQQIPAWLYLPQGVERASANLPVIVEVHGGPESQRRIEFNPVYQYFLSQGYAILAPNVRGSTGYGKTYEQLDNVAKRMDSVADLAHAARWLSASGIADPRRIAVMGGSYGGFMVLAAITEYPELWAAGVDIVGIANLVTFLEHTGPWRRHLREAEYGSLEHDHDLLVSISPIHKVDRITAPLLVIHGANDPRVPIGEAEQIVASLRARNHPVDYLRFEDEGHGIVKLNNRLVCYPAIARFLDAHLKK